MLCSFSNKLKTLKRDAFFWAGRLIGIVVEFSVTVNHGLASFKVNQKEEMGGPVWYGLMAWRLRVMT